MVRAGRYSNGGISEETDRERERESYPRQVKTDGGSLTLNIFAHGDIVEQSEGHRSRAVLHQVHEIPLQSVQSLLEGERERERERERRRERERERERESLGHE